MTLDPSEDLWSVLQTYPVLMLPEFPAALEALGRMQKDPQLTELCVSSALSLAELHALLKRDVPHEYAGLLFSCAEVVRDDPGGQQSFNLRAAVRCFHLAGFIFGSGSEFARSLMNEGSARSNLAELGIDIRANQQTAVELYEKARAIFGSGPDFAACLMNEGNARMHLAELGVDARVNLEQAISIYSQARPIVGSVRDVARCLINEGGARRGLAGLGIVARTNLEAAIQLYEEARVLLGSGPDLARCLINEGTAWWSLAELGVDARVNVEQAISVYSQARLIADSGRYIALSLMNEGGARGSLAKLGIEARSNLEISIELYKEAQGLLGSGPDFALSLTNEGVARMRLAGLGIEARTNLEAAIQLYEEARGSFGSGPEFALSLTNEGVARMGLAGLGIEARTNLEAAIQLYEEARVLLGSGPDLARCLINEGTAWWSLAELGVDAQTNLEVATQLYSEAAASLVSLGFRSNAVIAYSSLGRLRSRHEQWDAAQAAFADAIGTLENIRSEITQIRDRQAWMEKNIELFKGAVDACLHLDAFDEAVIYAERGRSRALADLLYMNELVPQNITTEQAEEYRQLRRQAAVLDALPTDDGHGLGATVGTGTSGGQPGLGLGVGSEFGEEVRGQERRQVLDRLRDLEAQFRQADPSFFALAQPLALDDLKQLAHDLDRTLVLPWIGPQQSVDFLVSPDGAFDHVLLQEVTDAVVREWMVGPADGPTLGGWLGMYQHYCTRQATLEEWMGQIDLTLELLYQHVLSPIHAWLTSRHQTDIALIVGGSLGLLPLHAAAWQDEQGVHYLSDHLDILYAPSAWILRNCVRRDRQTWAPVLAVGNPSTAGQQPLRGAERETEQIKRLVERRLGGGQVDLRIRTEATAEEVTTLLPTHPVAHFACHGAWNPNDALQSALYLAGPDRLTLAQLLGQIDMEQSSLVVLSACESATGYGPGSTGEEYLGLPAGFIVAGTKTVVGSLWPVDDDATALLMGWFYEYLLDGIEVQEALCAAQKRLRELRLDDLIQQDWRYEERRDLQARAPHPFAHPVFWAAFTVVGAPDRLVHL